MGSSTLRFNTYPGIHRMITVIAGSRHFTDKELFNKGMDSVPFVNEISLVIHGDALGADKLADIWAKGRGIPVKRFPVTKEEWEALGKRAGPLRNIRMINEADAYIGFWDGISRGTKQGIEYATKLQRRVAVVRIEAPVLEQPNLLKFMEGL